MKILYNVIYIDIIIIYCIYIYIYIVYILTISADPGRRKGERVREEEYLAQRATAVFPSGRSLMVFCCRELPFTSSCRRQNLSDVRSDVRGFVRVVLERHVREFFGVVLDLARPSEPWCFAAGSCFFRSCLTGISSSSRRHQSCEQPQATESLDNLSLDNRQMLFF